MTATAPADDKVDPKVIKTGLILVVGVLAVVFDTTIVSVALHTLVIDLHSSVSTIQWVSTGYLLALGMTVPLSTWGLRRYGGKRLWMFALTLFLVGSIGASLAWNADSLIAWRVVQGAAGGVLVSGLTPRIMQGAGGQALRRGHVARPGGHAHRAARAGRPDPRPARRGRDPDPPELAVHVLGERPVLP